jgi:hypothetical protein
LGVIARVVIPNLSVSDEAKLDVAAEEVASALRFARSEAMRTGLVHGVEFEYRPPFTTAPVDDLVKVYSRDASYNTVYDVRNPHDKKPYTFITSTLAHAGGVQITSGGFYACVPILGCAPFAWIDFGKIGEPSVSGVVLVAHATHNAVILSIGSRTRTVRVAPVTGRVTIS